MDQLKKILIVEDDQYARDLFNYIMQKGGFEIIQASDGEQALNMALQKPDLIMLDLLLPKIDGLTVLQKLKSTDQTKEIPVVILTNLYQDDLAQKAYELGAKGFINKTTMTPYQILEYIKSLL